jgi:hypothetical protein
LVSQDRRCATPLIELAIQTSPELRVGGSDATDGASLPEAVYEQHDLATLEDELIDIERNGLGEFDGNEIGPTETILYLYGPDADALFKGIEPTLRANPLCQIAKVTIRSGGPRPGNNRGFDSEENVTARALFCTAA